MSLPSVFNSSVNTEDEAEVEDRRTRAAIFFAGATLYSARAFLTERIKFWKLLNPATTEKEKKGEREKERKREKGRMREREERDRKKDRGK